MGFPKCENCESLIYKHEQCLLVQIPDRYVYSHKKCAKNMNILRFWRAVYLKRTDNLCFFYDTINDDNAREKASLLHRWVAEGTFREKNDEIIHISKVMINLFEDSREDVG